MKKITTLFACVVLLFSLFAFSTQATQAVGEIDKPYMINYVVASDGTCERVTIGCALTDDFAAYSGDKAKRAEHGFSYVNGYIQLDYRIDSGSWQYTKEWDTNASASFYGAMLNTGETVKTLDLLYLTNETAVKNGGALIKISDDGKKSFDLENHSLEFRLRSVLMYTTQEGNFNICSDWTETVKVERNQTAPEIPTEFEAPQILNPRVENLSDNQMPYFAFEINTPESIKAAQTVYATHAGSSIALVAYVDLGNGDGWQQTTLSSSGSYFSNETKHIYLDTATFNDEKQIKFKLNYMTYDKNDNPILSQASDTIKLTVPRWEEGKGVLPAKCTTCGICTPFGGKVCMFVALAIAAAIIIVAAIVAKMQIDKALVRKAEAEEEKQRKLEAERAAYNAKKQQNKQKNRK